MVRDIGLPERQSGGMCEEGNSFLHRMNLCRRRTLKLLDAREKYGLNDRWVSLSSLRVPHGSPGWSRMSCTTWLWTLTLPWRVHVDFSGPHFPHLHSWYGDWAYPMPSSPAPLGIRPRTVNVGRSSQPLGLFRCILWLWAHSFHPTLLLCWSSPPPLQTPDVLGSVLTRGFRERGWIKM